MSVGRIVLIVLAVLFALPILGIFVFNVAAAGYIFRMSSLVGEVSAEVEDRRSTDFNGATVVGGNQAGLYVLRKFDEFENARAVDLNIQTTLADIRRGDASADASEDEETYLAARLPELARAECELIVKLFAAKCAVNHVSSTEMGKLRNIRMRLAFVQRETFGAVPEKPELAYVEIPLNLNQAKKQTLLPENWKAARTRYYQAVAKACTSVRKKNGNCAIQSVAIRSTPDRQSSAVIVTAQSTMAILQ